MSVPKTPVDKNDGMVSGQHNIRLPRQVFRMKPKTKAGSMEQTSDEDFRLGVCPADAGHHPAAGFGRNSVSHVRLRRDGVSPLPSR